MTFESRFAAAFASSPFAAPVAETPAGAPEYVLIQSAPAVPAEECETNEVAIELEIRWGTSTLCVQHLSPPRPYFVGENADFSLPAEMLGTAKLPIVMVSQGAAPSVLVPPGATLRLTSAAGAILGLAEAIQASLAQPSATIAGGYEVALAALSAAEVTLADLTFKVASVRAGRVVGARSVDTTALPFHAGSLLVHASLLAAVAFFMPPLGASSGGDISAEQQYLMGQYLSAAAEKEVEPQTTDEVAKQDADGSDGGQGARAKLEEGVMGSQTSRDSNKRYAVEGPKDNPNPHLARAEALQMAQDFGMVGLLASAGGSQNAPTAPWGQSDALGNDALSARGNMWGETLGEAAGSGGLGLSGIGEGGGGRYEGIGLGRIGTIGNGDGGGTGTGIGNGHGLLQAGHKVKSPGMRTGIPTASGRIPPEVIQRIVRQSSGRFRGCYETALRGNPNLAGRVSVRFVIGRDGAVSNAANGGSDLPDAAAVSCVVRAFYGLSFPAPEVGIVTVTYPISFTPG